MPQTGTATIDVLDAILTALDSGGTVVHEDSRTEARERQLRAATAIWSDPTGGTTHIGAIVRNVSQHGLGLLLVDAVEMPETFDILFEDTGERLPCERRWQRGKQVGASARRLLG